MSVKFSNNGKTTVSSAVSGSTTTISVNDASVFPSISASDYFYVTLDNGQGDLEICKVTNVNTGTNKLTVVRAQEGTTASAFDLGTKVENRLTAGGLNDVLEQSNQDTLQDVTARGNTLTTNIKFSQDEGGIDWVRNTDAASIKFYNDSDADTNSRLEFHIRDNKNEFFLFTSYDHTTQSDSELLKIHPTADMTFRGNKVYDAGDFTNNATNWDAAYSWGDHGTEGYITSFDITEQTDPKYLRSDADNTTDKKLELIGANHHPLRIRRTTDANAGIVFEKEDGEGSIKTRTYFGIGNANGELTVGDEADTLGVGNKIWHSGDFDNNATEWDAAYSWGDHGAAGYLTTHQDISGKANLSGNNTFTGSITARTFISTPQVPDGDVEGGEIKLEGAGASEDVYIDNYSGDIRFFDSTQPQVRARLNTAGDLELTGELTASGYNNSNWDTAYGWGNHASAGYLTSHQDISGKADLSGNNVFTGYVQAKGGIQTNVISGFQPPGTEYGPQQLVLNAGESYGKVVNDEGVSTQTQEYVYVNAENGLRVCTPDSDHANWAAGYTVKQTDITGESITIDGNEVWHAGNLTDHANAGYLTSETHASAGYLTSHQDISGKLDRAGGTLKDSVDVEYSAGNTFNLLCNNTGFQTLNIASNELDAGVDKYIYIGKNTGNKAGNATFVELGDDSDGSLVKAYGDFKATGEISASGGNSGEWNTAYDWGNHADAGYITTHQNLPTSLPADGGNSDTVDNKHAADFFLRANGDVTGDFDNYTESGNYYVSNWNPADGTPIANGPTYTFNTDETETAYGWGMLRVSNFKTENSFIVQEYIAHQNDGIWMRIFWSSHGWTAWRQQYTNLSDTNTSGLNADTLDGQEGSYYTGYTDTATTNSGNWDTAYGWGDHSAQGYLTSHQSLDSYALKSYVDDEIAGLVDSSPDALNTLNELAAALGDDPNFATTVTQSIGTKWTQDDDKIGEWNAAYSRVDNTRLGLNSHSLVNFTSAEDYAKPAGYSTHMRGTGQEQNVVGTPKTASYWYYNVHARRDTGTGTAATLMNYDGNDFYYGTTGVKTSAPVWRRVWDDNNFSATDVSNWNTAYGWGNHADAGYLTRETHADAGYAAGNHGHEGLKGTWQTIDLDNIDGSDYSFHWDHYSKSSTNLPGSSTPDNANGVITANTHSSSYRHQIAFHSDEKLYHRAQAAGTWTGWQRILTTADDWDHSNAGYLTSHQDISGKLDKSGGTVTGGLTINTSNPNLIIQNSSGNGAGIKFKDIGDDTQYGNIEYFHQDGKSYGSGEAFVVRGDEPTMSFVVKGRVMYEDGLWVPGSANNSTKSVRKDLNWDTAYGWGDHAGLYLGASAKAADSDRLDGYHKSDINPAHSHKKWTSISAASTQAKRYTIMRLYGCPAHWDSNWQNIHLKVWSESYEASTLEYEIAGDYNGGNAETMYHLRLKDAGGSIQNKRFRLQLSDPVAAGWDYSGKPTYYVDVYAEAAYHMNFTVAADFYGHGYQTDTLPTSGGATTVVYSDPVQANIADFTEDKTDFYFGPHKVFNEANFTDNSSNWDTAYGWGDHADAGYLTSETHASAGYLTSHQDISGKLDKSGGTMTGQLTIEGTSPQMKFVDTGDHDDFWIHCNNNRFYVLPDRGEDGGWETPYALELDSDTNKSYTFGKEIWHEGNFTDNSSNWDTAYGWGDHADAGYLTSETHASAGYLTAVPSKQSPATAKELGNVDLDDYAQPADAGFYHQLANADADIEDNWPNGRAGSLLVQKGANSGNFGTTQLFIDYSQSNVYVRSMYADESADRAWKRLYTTSDFTNNSSNWNTAYGWGNHADAGYLTSETHASAGYLTSHQNISGKANLTGANFTGNIARVGTGNNDAPAADTTVMSGYGLIGNRVNPLYITNSAAGGSVQIGVGGAHNSNSKLSITADLASLTVPISTSGSITASGNVTAYSDERLKEDVETLDGSKVYEMRGVSFTKDGEAGSGVIAQELQKVAPELVHDDGEYLSVAYGNTIGYLIEAIKDLKAEVNDLTAKLEAKD